MICAIYTINISVLTVLELCDSPQCYHFSDSVQYFCKYMVEASTPVASGDVQILLKKHLLYSILIFLFAKSLVYAVLLHFRTIVEETPTFLKNFTLRESSESNMNK